MMAYKGDIHEAVPLGMLRRYLSAQGWRAVPTAVPSRMEGSGLKSAELPAFFKQRGGGQQNVDVYVFSDKGLEDIELVLPRDRSASDFVRRLEGVIETLSQLEGREPELIIADVRALGFDVVRSRIPEELVKDDTIRLVMATNYITGTKTLLASAATTEMRPEPYFLRIRKEATAYAEQCRFGHTFRGSFGFMIESPVSPNDSLTLPGVEQVPPFERRVIQRFAKGIRVLRDAVQLKDPRHVVKNVESGFNANVCESFAELVESTARSGMTFTFAFSPEWVVADDFKASRDYFVGPAHIEISREAAKLMRDQPFSRPEQVFGRIIRLQNEADPTDLFNQTVEREIVIQWSSEDLGDVQVKVPLTPTDYLLAVEAHRNGRPVKISGILERQGRRWVLRQATNLIIV